MLLSFSLSLSFTKSLRLDFFPLTASQLYYVHTVYLFLYWHDLLMYCIIVNMSKIVHLPMTTVANDFVMLSQLFNIKLNGGL